MSPKYVLGINCAYHESSATLLEDGVLVSAIEEERFNRAKHAKAARVDNPYVIPVNAIQYSLDKAGIEPNQIERIGFSFLPERRLMNIKVKDRTTKK